MNLGFLLMLNCWMILAFFSFVLLFVLHIDAFQGGRVSRGNGLRKLVMMPTLLVQTSAEIPSGGTISENFVYNSCNWIEKA